MAQCCLQTKCATPKSMALLRARTEPVPGGALLRARLPASLTARCWLVNSAAATSGMSDMEGIAPLERAPLPRSAHLMRWCSAGSAQLARVVTPGPRQACGFVWTQSSAREQQPAPWGVPLLILALCALRCSRAFPRLYLIQTRKNANAEQKRRRPHVLCCTVALPDVPPSPLCLACSFITNDVITNDVTPE